MLNRTETTHTQSSAEAIFLVSFTSIQCVVGSIANAFVLGFFWSRRKQYLKHSDKLTVNLALADFVALTTYVPWRAYLLYLRQKTKDSRYYTSLFVTCLFCTGNAVLLMALTRLFATIFPMKYRVFLTDKILNCLIVLSWMTAILLGIGHRLSYKDITNSHTNYELSLSSLSFCQLVVICAVYAMIFRSTKRAQNDFNHSYKLSWTTYVIVLLCYATFLPYTVYRIVSTADKSITMNEKRATWRWIIAFSFVNSCINPFIYFLTVKKFKGEIKRFLHIGQQSETETNGHSSKYNTRV